MEFDTVLLKCSSKVNDLLIPELQKGFYILTVEGQDVFKFLSEDCNMKSAYIREKIKTIFINGGPVDDIYNTRIKEYEEIALSGAMPGIVGAMMRIGSPYAPMRDNITVRPEEIINCGKKILVGLKLFNVILHDRGNGFLRNGIIFTRQRFEIYITRNINLILSDCSSIDINNINSDISNLLFYIKSFKEFIILKTDTSDECKS